MPTASAFSNACQAVKSGVLCWRPIIGTMSLTAIHDLEPEEISSFSESKELWKQENALRCLKFECWKSMDITELSRNDFHGRSEIQKRGNKFEWLQIINATSVQKSLTCVTPLCLTRQRATQPWQLWKEAIEDDPKWPTSRGSKLALGWTIFTYHENSWKDLFAKRISPPISKSAYTALPKR